MNFVSSKCHFMCRKAEKVLFKSLMAANTTYCGVSNDTVVGLHSAHVEVICSYERTLKKLLSTR